ncbi:MAG: DNA primase, partial [Coriobacteriales bacterium]|nr:DNA primase [Coriobacteriales bacterium]
MGRIEDDDIRRVREATDLVQLVAETVVLKQKGRLFWGCCPFHNEKTRSFKIVPGTQLWHCFGCGKGGDVFGYVMEREKLEFPEAVRQLADRAHIEIKESQGGMPRGQRQRIMDACEAAEEFFHTQLMRSK